MFSAFFADQGKMSRFVAIVFILLTACSEPQQPAGERKITSGLGYARTPVLSRDGTMAAFSAGPGDYRIAQIWVRRADASAAALQLTDDPSQNYDPEFSLDGSSVYFTSSRNPEGIYRVPVSGGSAELAMPGGYTAKISPDGKTLVYGASAKLYRRDLQGGPATPLLPEIENSYAPVWSPDSARILVTAKNRDENTPELWIVPALGSDPRKTSILASLRTQGFNLAVANAWLPGDWVVFTGRQGETQTLWKVRIDADGRVAGKAERVTDDPEGDSDASFAAGKLIYTRTAVDMNYWALPLDSTGEHLAGPPEQITDSAARKGQESAAGSKLLYSAEAGDRFALFLKDGAKEKRLRDGFFSELAPDGSRYVYGEGTKERLALSMKSLSWWRFWSTALCENCGMPSGFSPDGKKLLLWNDSPPIRHLDILDVASRRIERVVWSPDDLSGPRLSPDGRFVSFVAKMGKHQWQTFVAPVWQQRLLGSFEWIPITPVSDSFHFAFWSSRGDIIYILTAQGGSGNLKWLEAQRVDPETRRPIGEPAPVHEFADLLPPGMDPVWNTVAVSGDRIILELGGVSSNIWIK